MKNCIYILNGLSTPLTYDQLIEHYNNMSDEERGSGIVDFLYEISIQEKVTKELSELKDKYDPELIGDPDQFLTGELTTSKVDNIKLFTTQTFIDSEYFRDKDGKILVPYIDIDNFRQYLIDVNKSNMSLDEARDLADRTIGHWPQIAKDSRLIHKLLSKRYFFPSELEEDLKGTVLEGKSEMLYGQLGKAHKYCYSGIGNGSTNNIIKNLNMKCKLYGIDAEIIGHIDNIIIDPNGELHIINYKITTSLIDNEKKKKYKYQMALLKQMLAAEGFNTEYMTLSIIPIFVKYSDDFKSIETVEVYEKEGFTIEKGGKYIFKQFDDTAERFIKSKVKVNTPEIESINQSNKFLRALFDEKQITTKGIELSVNEWISRNVNHRIVPITDEPGVKYKIIFSPTDIVKIKDFHKPLNNDEIKEAVRERLNNLDLGNHEQSAHNIVRLFGVAMRQEGFFSFTQEKGYERCAKFFDRIFKPYLTGVKKRDGTFQPDWEIIQNDELLSRNVIALQNLHTKQIDVITVSPHNLQENPKFRDVYTNILGDFISDQTAGSRGIIKGNFGNIEMIRTMVLLNGILPNITGNYQLGQIQVISPENVGKEVTYTFSQAIEQFSKIRQTVIYDDANQDSYIPNNFQGVKTVDSLDIFLKMLDNSMSEIRTKINETGGFTLRDPNSTREQRVQALRQIMRSMENTYQFSGLDQLESLETKSPALSEAIKLYKYVSKALLQLEDISDKINYTENDITSLEADYQSAQNIGSENIRLIGNLFHQTVNKVANKSYDDTRTVRKYLDKYYDEIKYGSGRNAIVGDQASVFKNLFQEVNGKRIMKFRNPYTDTTLNNFEKEFLKNVLFTLAKTRKRMFPDKLKDFNFENYNSPDLKEYIDKNIWYLEVPLMKASKGTNRFTKYGFQEWVRKVKRIFTLDGAKNVVEFMDNLANENEVQKVQEAMSTLTVDNRYGWYETAGGCETSRLEHLESKPVEYFEYNIENILMNFITAQNEVEEMQDFMLKVKAILLELRSIGDGRLKNTLNYIDNYLKINVYNKSTLEDTSKSLVSIIAPARHLATSVYIMGNLASGVRDLTEGLLQNFVRSVIKFQTNISPKNLSSAYKYVTRHSLSNIMSINLLNQLNIKYRISNVDLARIQEVLTTGRDGIKNYDNWLYATLRKPDFINRMSLFVARCMQDGVWKALSVDEDGNFKYDWKEDERFKYYADHKDNPPENDKEFLESKGRYFSALMEYNRENPNTPLNIQDPDVSLPNPYTNAEVESIKIAADSIYGSYDKSKKSMYEFQTKGIILGQFTTWMNGMVGNYFRKPGSKTGELMLIPSKSEAGEEEFLDEYNNIVVKRFRENGEEYYYNETTGQEVTGKVAPLFKNVPISSQGIIYSVYDMISKTIPLGWKNNGIEGVIDEIKKEMLLNPQEAKNFLKLISDLIMWIFLGTLYQFVVDPAYKELKKKRDKEDLLVNSIEDILYKGTASSYDGFRGPWNIIDSFGNNMNPPAYKVTTKMITDASKTIIGKESVGEFLTRNVPVLRSFKVAYDQYNK